MAVVCEPKDLAAASACFCGVPPGDRDAILIFLLATIAGGSMDPNVLAESAKAYRGYDKRTAQAVMVYLMCSIASA